MKNSMKKDGKVRKDVLKKSSEEEAAQKPRDHLTRVCDRKAF